MARKITIEIKPLAAAKAAEVTLDGIKIDFVAELPDDALDGIKTAGFVAELPDHQTVTTVLINAAGYRSFEKQIDLGGEEGIQIWLEVELRLAR